MDWQSFSVRPPVNQSIEYWLNYRFRASALHRLCAGGSELTEGNKKYLEQLFYYGEPSFTSAPLEKGIICENLAFDKYGKGFYRKSPFELGNQFIKGSPDIVLKTKIIDIKCPFTVDSFEKYDQKKARHYYWQLQAYMILTGLKCADILACWINTPTDILVKYDLLDTRHLHNAKKLTTKRFKFNFSPTAKKLIYNKIKLARKYFIKLYEPYSALFKRTNRKRNYK